MTRSAPRVFSGVQPTGNLHLGNYLGAITRFVEMQKTHNCIYCVVDMHAITVWQDPDALRRQTRELAAGFIAAGLHVNDAQTRIANYSQWQQREDFLAMLRTDEMRTRNRRIGELCKSFEPVMYDVAATFD